MFKNYFKLAWRNIIKSRFYSLVNIIGLSTGIAFTLLIGAYVFGELQVNSTLKNIDQQYILESRWKDPNMGQSLTSLGNLPKFLKEQYPNLVANYYRWDGITSVVHTGEQHNREGLQVGDSSFLNMYGFSLQYGNATSALTDPFSVVISEAKAMKYFGKTNVVGQTLSIENFSGSKHDFTVTGVLNKPAKNSVLNINDDNNNEFILSTGAAKFFGRTIDAWNNPYIVCYVELQKGISAQSLVGPIKQLMTDNASQQLNANLTPTLVPIKNYYLQANNGLAKKMTWTLSFIAIFILLMAVINFINMCISRSTSRMKEIGIRKVLGSTRQQLIAQFLSESILLVFASTMIAIVIYIIVRPIFIDILGKELLSITAFPWYFILVPFTLPIVVGLLAGIYPAFVLSAMKSIESLKGQAGAVKEKVFFRKTLVAFQFATAAVVLISAFIISQQVNLFFSNDLGYNKDRVVYAALPRDWSPAGVQKMESIRREFETIPAVEKASVSYEIPNGKNGNQLQLFKPGQDSASAIASQLLVTDNQYAATYNIPMKAGSFFTASYSSGDSAKVVINETQSKALGWSDPKEAIGQQLRIPAFPTALTVCGVTADFHFGSMQQAIQPITFMNVNWNPIYRFVSFKLSAGDISNDVAALQKKWSQVLPGAPFEYKFMDDALSKLYQTEIQLKKASYAATVLAMIIVLLGLVGLVALSVQKRQKEIGIRKVLGSSAIGILQLFLKEFLSVIGIACLIACPLAYITMNHWLNDYTYRIHITPVPFVMSIAGLGLLTALLISIQTFKTAMTNPVKSLRTE